MIQPFQQCQLRNQLFQSLTLNLRISNFDQHKLETLHFEIEFWEIEEMLGGKNQILRSKRI